MTQSFGTHDGSFHADEVTACSLLLVFQLIDRKKVHRTRDPKILERCDFVCDVGGVYDPIRKRFDHHQADYRGTMSSAGMILLYLRDKGFMTAHEYEHFNRSLVMGVDAHDNGFAKLEAGTATFSQIVSNFLPIDYDANDDEMNRCFFHAVDFVVGHLTRFRERLKYSHACQEVVREQMNVGTVALVFDQSLPWLENFFELGGEGHPALFVIMPSGSHWKLRAIPPSMGDRMRVRKPLPERWAGLRDEELRRASGISGAIFCHKGRFISIWETKQDALKALQIALEDR